MALMLKMNAVWLWAGKWSEEGSRFSLFRKMKQLSQHSCIGSCS